MTALTERAIWEECLNRIKWYLRTSVEEFCVTGAAVAIVHNGDVILQETLGYRDATNALPVTPETIFPIGSISKAFGTMSIAMLSDDGLLEWDKPIVHYLPEFRLSDAWATREATARDLASHRTGIATAHDTMNYRCGLSRSEVVERLPYLGLSHPFRTKWQYSNLMYEALGYLVDRVSRRSWEQFVTERIFSPLGMERSNYSIEVSKRDSNYAKPYRLDADGNQDEIDFVNLDAIGPAGAINSSLLDMQSWLALQLNGGQTNKAEGVGPKNPSLLLHPQILLDSPNSKTTLFRSYALGWFTEVFRGKALVHHGGNIDGFTSKVAMIPEENLGIIILTNQDFTLFPDAAMYSIFDALLSFDDVPWNTKYLSAWKQIHGSVAEEKDQKPPSIPGTSPSHELRHYVGRFQHPAYGSLDVSIHNQQLYVKYHAFVDPLQLQHLHFDTFTIEKWKGLFIGRFTVQFLLAQEGTITTANVTFDPTVGPISFTRQ